MICPALMRTIPPMNIAGDMNELLLAPNRASSTSTHPMITIRVPGACMKNVFLGASIFI